MTPDSLATLPMFAGVPRAELAQLLELCPIVSFAPHSIVFRQGEPSTHALLVVGGALEASTQAGGERTVLGTVRAGDLTGESGLMMLTESRGATLTATHSVHALRIQRDDLVTLSGTAVLAAIQMRMLAATARRLRSTQATMQRQARSYGPPPTEDPTAPLPPRSSRWAAFLDALGALV